MSGSVVRLPTTRALDAAWDRYAEMRRRELADPRLMIDRAHCEAVALAYEAWRDLFLKSERKR